MDISRISNIESTIAAPPIRGFVVTPVEGVGGVSSLLLAVRGIQRD
ncbi:MAG: hypothetical protein M3332_00765 [Actinomycetota bacterium]|nr:hypothetical protein [Actinomycetota bacterium]